MQESELFNRRIIESSNDCIKILDLDGNLLYVNEQGRRLLEMGEDDSSIGKYWPEFWDEADRREVLVELEKAKTGLTGRLQGQARTFRGRMKWWDVMITPIAGVHGGVERLLVVSRDITQQKTASEKLLVRQRFFRSLIENAHDVITVLDLEGHLVYESPACERVFGYGPDERIGVNCFEYLHEDDRERVGKIFADAVRLKGSTDLTEYRYRHKNGGWVTVEVIAKYSHDEADTPVMIINKRDVTDRRQAHEQLQRLTAQLLNLQDEERRRLARELHDGTAQNLAAIGINIATLKQEAAADKRLLKVLDQTRELTDTSLQEIRTMSYLLHPPMLEEAGLSSALRWFIDGYTDRTSIKVGLQISKDLGRLPHDIETAIYRIVQEGLNNIYRHSGSPVAHVSLRRKQSDVMVKIRDEGRGLPGGSRFDSGVGIRGMKERLRLLGGKFDIVSGVGGTTLKAVIPLDGAK